LWLRSDIVIVRYINSYCYLLTYVCIIEYNTTQYSFNERLAECNIQAVRVNERKTVNSYQVQVQNALQKTIH